MPPRKYKVDHRHGGGGKHVSSFDEVKARNAGEESAYDRARREAREKKKKDDEEAEKVASSSEEEEQEKPKVPARRALVEGFEIENPNATKRNEEKEGVELTRKQREELDKAAARRRYEELHKAGKTDEAKADLARLEEVKRRREEAAKKRAEEEAKLKEKEGDKGKGRSVLIDELKVAMGSEAARMRGDRSKKKDDKDEKEKEKPKSKDQDKEPEQEKAAEPEKPKEDETGRKKKIMNGVDENEVYSSYAAAVAVKKDAKPEKPTKAVDGTIEACRAAEADFM